MIIRKFFEERNDGVILYRSYSDKDVYIRKIGTNEEYSEAIDVEDAPYRYEETERLIEKIPEEEYDYEH